MTNKKEKINKSIINALIVNFAIFLIFVSILFFYVYPEYNKIEQEKEKLKVLVNNYNLEKNKWIKFSILKEKINKKIEKLEGKKNKEKLKEILNMKNYLEELKKENKNKDFLSFLEKKSNELEKIENSKNLISLEKNIENILPSYIENNEEISTLNDLKFINYLEKLFLAFNLKNQTEIWIWNIVALEDEKIVKKINLNQNQNQIFYIPIKLELSWKKINIVKFLYFLENVWKINLYEEKNINKKDSKKQEKILKINFFTDKNNVLKDENFVMWEENIYANMLSIISNIKMNEYIDSKLANKKEIETELDFIKYIKETQEDDDYKISLELRFYIKWLPKYKLREYILDVIKNYKITIKNVAKISNLSQKEIFNWKDPLLISQLESLKKYLDWKEKEINIILKTLSKQNNLVWTYNKMRILEEKLKQANNILEKLKEKN